jgi:ABC-type antimicrobial peptide transport system permease subunit
MGEGAIMAAIGIAAGAVCGYILARIVGSQVIDVQAPSAMPTVAAAGVLLLAAIAASALPAMRAARVDVLQALRSE